MNSAAPQRKGETAAEFHARLLEASPILPGGQPYGIAEFAGDVEENNDCRRVAQKIHALGRGIRWKSTIEIGTGGGRWSRWLHPRTDHLLTVDATPKARLHIDALHLQPPPICIVSKYGQLPTGKGSPLHQAFDLAFSYDTFVHLPKAIITTYMRSISDALQIGAYFVLHYGTRHGARQDQPIADNNHWTYLEPYWINTQAGIARFQLIDNWTVSCGFGSAVSVYRKKG